MADRIGQHFGDYRLVRLIGQGDFGVVFLGEHLRHSGQAAIKVLHTRLRNVDALHFHYEEQRIYNLNHPHMVRLLDYDIKDEIPFLIMDYLPNGTLRQRYPEGTRLPLADILSYVKQIADVLQYAHDRNLIHCGVKPENMLLGRNNAVLLSDFCLPLLVGSSYSQGKQVNYLAPEQIQGHPVPASDQYALGIVVYEWINGARPFDGSSPEIISKYLTMPPPPLRDKNPGLSNAIEQVVLKALAKDPKGRFPSVQDFAKDLEQAILSRPHICTRREAVKWGLVMLAGAIATTTIIAVVKAHANPPPTPTPTPKRSPTPAPLGTTLNTYNGNHGTVFAVVWSPHGDRIASASSDGTAQVWDAFTGGHVLKYSLHKAEVKTVAWSHDGKYIASGSRDSTVRIWDATTGIDTPPSPYTGHSGAVRGIAWSRDGKFIASGSEDTTVQVWNTTTKQLLFSYKHQNGVLAVAWSPNGNYIASGSFGPNPTVQVWNVTTRSLVFTYKNHKNDVRALAWSPDSTRIASGSFDTTVQVWNTTTGVDASFSPYHGHKDQVHAVAWSHDGTRLASGSGSIKNIDDTVQIWNANTGQHIYSYPHHSKEVWGVAWSPDDIYIASGSFDRTVQVWRAE